MKHFGTAIAVAAIGMSLAACTTPQQQIATKEDRLAAAGFRIILANTPERQASLKTLPPNKFAKQVRGDRIVYVWPDPIVCGCLYVGSQQAYGTYRQNQLAKNIADENLMAANENAMAYWDWGPWGPY